MITVVYTQQELQALTHLLDMATKAGGLQVAGVATILNQKHMLALQDSQTPATPEETKEG